MGWRDGTIRDVMAAEMVAADEMLAEVERALAEQVRMALLSCWDDVATTGASGVIEATYRMIEDAQMPPDTNVFLGDNGSLVVVDNLGDGRTA